MDGAPPLVYCADWTQDWHEYASPWELLVFFSSYGICDDNRRVEYRGSPEALWNDCWISGWIRMSIHWQWPKPQFSCTSLHFSAHSHFYPYPLEWITQKQFTVYSRTEHWGDVPSNSIQKVALCWSYQPYYQKGTCKAPLIVLSSSFTWIWSLYHISESRFQELPTVQLEMLPEAPFHQSTFQWLEQCQLPCFFQACCHLRGPHVFARDTTSTVQVQRHTKIGKDQNLKWLSSSKWDQLRRIKSNKKVLLVFSKIGSLSTSYCLVSLHYLGLF